MLSGEFDAARKAAEALRAKGSLDDARWNEITAVVEAHDTALRADTSLEGRIALAFWEYANQIDRNGALVARLGAVLGLSSAQIDAMFIQAAGIAA